MTFTRFRFLFLLSCLMLFSACGGSETSNEFQQNNPPKYDLTKVTDGYGAVDDAYESIDAASFNSRLKDAIDDTGGEFELSSYTFHDVLTDSNAPLSEITDSRRRHPERLDVGAFYQIK